MEIRANVITLLWTHRFEALLFPQVPEYFHAIRKEIDMHETEYEGNINEEESDRPMFGEGGATSWDSAHGPAFLF